MLLKDYLKKVSALDTDTVKFGSVKEKLLQLIPQSKFDELVERMQQVKGWENQGIVNEISNHMEAASMFRNYRETYTSQPEDYGLVNKIIAYVTSKKDSRPGDVVCDYRKNSNFEYSQYEDGSHQISAVFHPNHSLIWVVETNNKVAGHPDQFYYGEGVKYIIYVYTPSAEVRKNCHAIKVRESLENKGILDEIKAIEEEAANKIAALKSKAGIKE